MKKSLLTLALVVCMMLGPGMVAPHALAAPPSDADLGESAAFLQLFPALRTLGAPVWFRPGVRASYQAAGAAFSGGSSGSGGGIVQYNVVALDAERGWATATSFGDNGAGALVPLGSGSPIVGLPAIGEFWINPAVLVNAEAVANPNLAVVRLNKTVNGQAFTVVRFQSTTTSGRNVWEFDAASGILIFYSQSATDPNTGLSSAVQSTFLGLRTPSLPWQPTVAPNWARPGANLIYTGNQATFIAGAGSGPTLPLQLTAQLVDATPTWSLFNTASSLGGVASGQAPFITGIGQVGGYWLPRTALAVNVSQPVVVDVDPFTGATTTLARNQSGDIVITQSARAFQTITVYNRTLGSLDALRQTIAYPVNTTQIQLGRTGGSDLNALNAQPANPAPGQHQIFLPTLIK